MAIIGVMKLVTPKQAARVAGVSAATVHRWVRLGQVTKHPVPLAEITKKVRPHLGEYSKRNYYVNLDDFMTARPASTADMVRSMYPDLRLLTVREIANILNVETFTVRHYARRFALQKYRHEGSQEFLLNGDELADAMEDNGLGYLVR